MVLPFGLNAEVQAAGDGQSSSTITHAPTAPPAVPCLLLPGQQTVSTGVPIIPSPYIDFIIVNNDDRYMIRCERKAVLENSVELAKLIHAGPNSGRKGDNHFQISNVDKNDFELVIRYLETNFVKYRDHLHILKILELANRFNCPDLIVHCIRELDLLLTSATVIDIFRSMWFYQNIMPANGGRAVITTENKETGKGKSKKAYVSTRTSAEDFGFALLHNALQLIDMHAALILTKTEICDLRFEELEMIAKRDALQLNSELVLFTCLADWSIKECERRKLDPSAENRRRMLGPLCYAPRYLIMSEIEFRKACDRVELLDPVEIVFVTDAHVKGKKVKNLSNEQCQLLEKFRTPRPEFAEMPIHLSDRSNPKNYPKKMRKAEKNASVKCHVECGGGGDCIALVYVMRICSLHTITEE